MSNTLKIFKHRERLPLKSTGLQSKASHDLRRLLSLLARSTRRQEVAALSPSKARNSGASKSQGLHSKDSHTHKSESDVISEASELEKFSVVYKDQRSFSSHPLQKLFSDLLISLVKNRLCSEWIDHASSGSVLRVLLCLRILVRDTELQKLFHQHKGITLLAKYMESVSALYISCGEQALAGQKLVTMTYMFQKMSASGNLRAHIMESGAYKTLVHLLSSTDSSVLLGALLALTTLAENSECREQIGELQIVENLLIILQEYDLLSKRMAAELLRLLSLVHEVREQLRALEGLPVLLSLLHGKHHKLLWSVCWVLVQLCEEPDARVEIRSWGGVHQLLRLLNSDRRYVSDRSSIETLSSANAAGRIHRLHTREELSPQEEQDNVTALQSACCTALTELSLDDSCAHHIVQENGVFIIAKLILPHISGSKAALQCYAFRTLRFLFSVERNRHLFKRLFPTDLFEVFIDVGHYVRDLAAYEALQTKVSCYSEEELDDLRDSITAVDQNRPPLRVINDYAILDHLGTGAFGSVFKVRKQSSQSLLALKEVNLHNPAFGKDKKSRDSHVEKIISELSIIKEQMAHPNVVKYYKTFLQGEKLYIVMELIEGVPLAEHFNSLKEKKQQFAEDRLWHIFIQMCLALRYLHKDKRIVHRDLTPNNIMLGDRDKVTITDFGLAKQKQENSKLTSVVGTILYSCPEVVKNEPYGEKADVWALGCVLYQMATLQPPFYSTNMLSLASKIVEAVYKPVADGSYSERVTNMIRWCLSPDPDQRPDIVAVSSRISDLMMRVMDSLYSSQNALERRAERDRKRAQKYFLEKNQSRVNCCHSTLPQEKSSLKTDPSTPIEQNLLQDNGSDEEVELLDINTNSPTPSGEDCGFKPKLCLTPDQLLECGECVSAKTKVRPGSVPAGLCVSQRKLRQIDDPINRLLMQLHKIIFITQLPPVPQHNVKRRLIERFKKSLFHVGSDPYHLKVELSKLLQTSPDVMELGSSSDWWPLVQHFSGDAQTPDSTGDGVTYEQMQVIIEELLEENGYYETNHSRCTQKGREQDKK